MNIWIDGIKGSMTAREHGLQYEFVGVLVRQDSTMYSILFHLTRIFNIDPKLH